MNIDWKQFRDQKQYLIHLANAATESKDCDGQALLDGVINFLDEFQDKNQPPNRLFNVEVTKVIVVAMEGESYEDACRNIENSEPDGDFEQSFHSAELQFKLLDDGRNWR